MDIMNERQESTRPGVVPGWNKRVAVGLILALLGVWVSLILTRYHLSGGKTQAAGFNTVCEITGGGCDKILLSYWSTIPSTGIPVAFVGVVYFLAIAIWYFAVGRANSAGRSWGRAFLALQLFGGVVSLFLIGVMLVQLRSVCAWCAIAHAINLLLVWIAWSLRPRGPRVEGERAWPPARLGWTALLLVVALAGFLERFLVAEYWETQARVFHDDVDLLRYAVIRGEPKQIPLRADDQGRGAATEPHTVVVYSDFQCPGCKNFSTIMKEDVFPLSGVRLVYRHFPVDTDCNPHVPLTAHPQACEAAHAAEAARELGGTEAFWKMHDALFARTEDVEAGRWAELAESIGLDGAAVAQRVAQRAHLDRIQKDIEEGHALGMEVTPTVFIDGHLMKEWNYPALWKAILEAPATPPAAPQETVAAEPAPAAP